MVIEGPLHSGPYMLPSRCSRDAPETFKGHYTCVKDFLHQYDQLLTQCQITSNQEKCEGITNYTSTSVTCLIKSLDDYQAND